MSSPETITEESFLDGKVRLLCGDNGAALRTLADNSIDSIVTDPPYGLQFMGREWDKLWRNETDADTAYVERTDGKLTSRARKLPDYSAMQRGPQMQEFHAAWAEAAFRALKPGGHLIAFSSTRTYHWMAAAIECAGFEVRDQIAWCYGSGFPKSRNIGDGWGTALKPAWEPICLGRKPFTGTVAANVLQHGTGAINVDGCRVGIRERPKVTDPKRTSNTYGEIDSPGGKLLPDARWPANLIHDGSEEVLAAFPDIHGAGHGDYSKTRESYDASSYHIPDGELFRYGDSGSAARFFYQAKFSGDDLEWNRRANDAEPCLFQCLPLSEDFVQKNVDSPHLSKIVQNVRSAGFQCASCATVIARALAEVRQSGNAALLPSICSTVGSSATILSHSLASYVAHRESTDIILTTTSLRELFGCVSHAIAENIRSVRSADLGNIGPERRRLFYTSKADSDDRIGSKHPTVKPVDLMQWLVRLVTPKGGTVLDPFAGTGTTAEAAFYEGMNCILIEREAEYQDDIRRRMRLALAGPDERARESIKAKTKDKPVDHGPLFQHEPSPEWTEMWSRPFEETNPDYKPETAVTSAQRGPEE